VTGFFYPVPVFGVDRFDDRSSSCSTGRIKGLQHINDHTNNKRDKGLQSLYYDISVDYKMVECG
jgi:hypothetical protein